MTFDLKVGTLDSVIIAVYIVGIVTLGLWAGTLQRRRSQGLVWCNPLAVFREPDWPGIGNYRVLAPLLLAIVILSHVIFWKIISHCPNACVASKTKNIFEANGQRRIVEPHGLAGLGT